MVGFIQNGETNTQEFQVKTRLETPKINWENSKVGWTSAVLEWEKVPRAQGYQLIVYADDLLEDVVFEKVLTSQETQVDVQQLGTVLDKKIILKIHFINNVPTHKLSHNKHNQNKHIFQNKHTVFDLTKMCLL